jgi:hypothetical protein
MRGDTMKTDKMNVTAGKIRDHYYFNSDAGERIISALNAGEPVEENEALKLAPLVEDSNAVEFEDVTWLLRIEYRHIELLTLAAFTFDLIDGRKSYLARNAQIIARHWLNNKDSVTPKAIGNLITALTKKRDDAEINPEICDDIALNMLRAIANDNPGSSSFPAMQAINTAWYMLEIENDSLKRGKIALLKYKLANMLKNA